MPRPVPVRGVIEGFYGVPWSHETRLDLIEFIGAHGMNAYVYAPKDDDKHRARWREPYDEAESSDFAALAAACRSAGVRFGFALSPGLDIDYSNGDDRDALMAKLAPLLDVGLDWCVLALDDIPARPGLAKDQAGLARWLLEALRARNAAVRLTLVPTEYLGTRPSPYLEDLAAGLPPDLELMWTGPTVCSPVITADDARAWRAAVGDHPLLLWDNYPVNDATMTHELHLGPYRGRAPELTDVVDGVLCNPMVQPYASKVALATAADFLASPGNYDEQASWERAIAEVGGARAPALGALARACAYGPLLPPEELHAASLLETLIAELDGPGWPAAVTSMRDELSAIRAAGSAWSDVPDDPLGDELRPWTTQGVLEAEAGMAALRLLQHVRPVAHVSDGGSGRAAPPDAELALMHAFAVVFAWTAARDASQAVVLGPRFAVHTSIVQLPDGRPALDIGLAVHEDESVIDELCRVALDHYARWAELPEEPLRLMAVDREITLDDDRRFAVDAGAVVLIRCGPLVTRISGTATSPFPDPRLS